MKFKLNNTLAGLPDNIRILTAFDSVDSTTLVIAPADGINRRCPACSSDHSVIRSSRQKCLVQHNACAMRAILLSFEKVPLSCRNCGNRFTFSPVPTRGRITESLYLAIFIDLCAKRTIREIASSNFVTEKIVRDVLSSVDYGLPEYLPETVSIDEFKGHAGTYDPATKHWKKPRYLCSISDGEANNVIDVLDYDNPNEVIQYFMQFPLELRREVKYFTCDMSRGFGKVAHHCFPEASLCIDFFHVIQRLNKGLDSIRIREQHRLLDFELDEAGYNTLKRNARLLTTKVINFGTYWPEAMEIRLKRLESVFCLSPDLREYHEALQNFHSLLQYGMPERKVYFTEWPDNADRSEIPELRSASKALRFHKKGIINNWSCHRANSGLEGLNNKTKVLKRLSFGMNSFAIFRTHIRMVCGEPKSLVSGPHKSYLMPDFKGKKKQMAGSESGLPASLKGGNQD